MTEWTGPERQELLESLECGRMAEAIASAERTLADLEANTRRAEAWADSAPTRNERRARRRKVATLVQRGAKARARLERHITTMREKFANGGFTVAELDQGDAALDDILGDTIQ